MATGWKTFLFLLYLVNLSNAIHENLVSSAETTKLPDKIPKTLLELNSCFRYVPEVRLKISSEHIGGTESIQFKDECLKACLRSMILKVFVCKSLMHIPGDDDCLLTTTDMKHAEYEKSNDFPQTNYYENLCVQNPYGSTAVLTEVQFKSFRGGDGILQIAQKYGQPTKAFLMIEGLRENTNIQIRHYQNNVEDCYKLKKSDVARSKPLFETTTDYVGSAIMAWNNIDLESNYKNLLETWILIIEGDHTIVECGRVHLGLDGHGPVNGDPKTTFNLLIVFLAGYFLL